MDNNENYQNQSEGTVNENEQMVPTQAPGPVATASDPEAHYEQSSNANASANSPETFSNNLHIKQLLNFLQRYIIFL